MSDDFPAQLTEFQVGSVLAGYRLEEQVGRGGFAVVFRALDERLGRPVALKILSPALASSSPEFRRRFIAESRAAAAVDDPHIIPVYEAGQADGVLFIAMRYVAGGDLRQVLEREGALPPDRAADFVSPVASALDAAHGAGLVHRDVKPGNILVDARAGRPDHVYLSDFGIVKGAALGSLTGVGSSSLGTPAYMAPEQISGQAVDGRTDQYSLACVAVQLLTGTVPFERDQLTAIIYAHLSVPPPSLVSRRPDLPAAVDQVVAKAMAKTPEKRYESCSAFADALREALGLTSYHSRSSASAPPRPQPALTPTSSGPAAATADRQLSGDPGTTIVPGVSAGELARPTDAGSGSGSDGAPPAQRPPGRRGPVTAWILRHRLPVFALTCVAVAAAVTIPLVSPGRPASPAPPAPSTGWISLGNLSASPSPVDVYLYSSGDSRPKFVQHDVAYGTILPYQRVDVGDYSVKMRAAGSSASSNPVWSVSLTVTAGGAYTVAPLRASAQQGQLKVIDDNLTTPKGESFVRVIQADIDQGQVTFHCSCAAGAPGDITTDAAPGTVSPQAKIPTGTWTMTATGPSAKTSLPVALTAGTVHTEIVVAAPGGGIEIINLTDAAGAGQAPTGGGSAGFGGTGLSYRRVPVDLPSQWRFIPITSLAFSPSGATLAIATGKICLWDIAAARCTSILGNVNTYPVAFSPDGQILAAANGNGGTYLWNVATNSQTATFPDPDSAYVQSVAFSPDGQILAAGDGNGRTYLWDIATGKPILSLPDPDSAYVQSVAFSPDGQILAAGDRNGRTYLWNVASGKLIVTLSDSSRGDVKSVAFSPDGQILAAGDGDGRTYLWNVATGKLISVLPDPGGKGVLSVAFSPDDTTMAAGDENGKTYLWNAHTGKLIATLAYPDDVQINSVAFSADGKDLATADQDGRVSLWYVSLRRSRAPEAPAAASTARPGPVSLLAAHTGGQLPATNSDITVFP